MKLFAGFILSMILTGCMSAQTHTAVPQELVGKWFSGSVSLLQDVDKVTGVIRTASGSSIGYEINSDGTFQYIGLIKSTMYNCTTSLFNHKKGKFKIQGSKITFTPSKDYWRTDYSCSPNSNKEQNKALKDETYTYAIKTDDRGVEHLALTGEDGKEITYPRRKE